MFNLNLPKDAISQFRLHTDRSENEIERKVGDV